MCFFFALEFLVLLQALCYAWIMQEDKRVTMIHVNLAVEWTHLLNPEVSV